MKKIINLIKNPLFSGSAMMVIGSNSASVINYIYHFIMGRMLGPSLYGELASLISLIGLLGIIPASLSLVIIKNISSAKDEKEINNLIAWLKSKVFQASIIFFFVVLLISPFVASFLNITKISYLFLIALSFLFSMQILVNRSVLQGLLKFKEMVLSILIENISKVVFSVALVFIGFRVGGAMAAFVISSLTGWYVTNLYLKKHFKKDADFSIDLKPIFLFTIPVLIQSFSITSLYSADLMLVKHFFSSHDAGIYAALSTLGKIIFFGAGPIGAVMFPLVAKRKARGEDYKRIFLYSFLLTGFLATAASVIYYLFPQIAIGILYGSAYVESSNLLIWFGVFMSLFTLSSLLISYSLSIGRTNIVFLPLAAAFLQIIAIWFYHQTLFMVVLISTLVCALLLASLLIYLSFKKDKLWK